MKLRRETVVKHIEHWSAALERSGRDWWPRFAYHFTDVQNAVSILNSGRLYSRERAMQLGVMLHDNANPEVIAQTDPEHLRLVRLYFRPLTPTQYRNEGILQRASQSKGHCPCPVYFLFDLPLVLQAPGCRFSRGTLATSRSGHSELESYFVGMPWSDVYSEGPMAGSRKKEIKQARHAEIIIPDEYEFGPALRAVYARSPAELATLTHGLDRAVVETLGARIRIGYGQLFYHRGNFVKSVSGSGGTDIDIRFWDSADHPQSIEFRFSGDGDTRRWSHSDAIPPGQTEVRYRLRRSYADGVMSLSVEGCQAFHARVDLGGLPF